MITREEMFRIAGVLSDAIDVDGIIDDAYRRMSEHSWKSKLDDVHLERGHRWHTSFHVSQFPGDDPNSCGRKLVYSLLGVPSSEPIDPRGLTVMEAGKDLEERIVWRLAFTGKLLTDPPDRPQQQFVAPEVWLTGAPDAIILIVEGRGHVLEFKGKDHDKVQELLDGTLQPDPGQVRQTRGYIGLAHDQAPERYGVRVDTGTLVYVSRQRPWLRATFQYEHDDEFMRQGYEKLRAARDAFVLGTVPERPKQWRWTQEPCRWCDYKRGCKQDIKEGRYQLEHSALIDQASRVWPGYTYDGARSAVLARWNT